MEGALVSFEEFVAARLPALVRYAAVLAGDGHLAQDIVQDALVRAHARWRRIAAMQAPEQYVKKMVTTEFLSWRRRRARRASILARQRWFTELVVSDHAVQAAERSALWKQLAMLPARQRAVLVLGYYEGLTDAEIGSILDCGPGTVRVYRSRALTALRTAMAPPFPVSGMAEETS